MRRPTKRTEGTDSGSLRRSSQHRLAGLPAKGASALPSPGSCHLTCPLRHHCHTVYQQKRWPRPSPPTQSLVQGHPSRKLYEVSGGWTIECGAGGGCLTGVGFTSREQLECKDLLKDWGSHSDSCHHRRLWHPVPLTACVSPSRAPGGSSFSHG